MKDASGIGELKEVLHRLSGHGAGEEFQFYREAEEVLLAFERITGKSFGEIPLNPTLSNDGGRAQTLAAQYHALVSAWAAWWDWAPPTKQGTN